jgi:hypothetical protein
MSAAQGLLFVRIAIGVLFAASAFGKLTARRDFELAVAGFRLLPRRWVPAAAVAVPAAEVLVVLLVGVGGSLLVPGLLLAILLLAVFSAVLVSALRRGLDVGCNCFGPGVRLVQPADVARNAALVLCAAGGLVLAATAGDGRVSAGQAAVLAGMAVVFVLVVSNLGDIATTLREPL